MHPACSELKVLEERYRQDAYGRRLPSERLPLRQMVLIANPSAARPPVPAPAAAIRPPLREPLFAELNRAAQLGEFLCRIRAQPSSPQSPHVPAG